MAGRELGISTTGTAPKGWLTEDGPREALLRSFRLKECSERGYPPRTKANVLNADGTLIVGPYRTGGSALTAKIAADHNKPLFHVAYPGPTDFASRDDRIEEFHYWLTHYRIQILNVAGNRESQSPRICQFTRDFLIAALRPEG